MSYKSNMDQVLWFSTMSGTIGIVKKKDEITDEMKFYIGVGHGHDENLDATYIQQWGQKVNKDVLLKFFEDGDI